VQKDQSQWNFCVVKNKSQQNCCVASGYSYSVNPLQVMTNAVPMYVARHSVAMTSVVANAI
jgi:hypothetical protein